MKRFYYALLIVGLALSLTGCGESGGGTASNPARASGDASPTVLGNNNVAANVLGIGTYGAASGGVVSAMGNSLGGCPALADFGFQMPASLGGAGGFSPFGKILAGINAGSRSRTKSDAAAQGLSLSTATSNWVNFKSASKSYSYGNVSVTFEYDFYLKFMDATGKALTIDTASSAFWAFSGASANDVDQIWYYGTWKASIKATSSSSSSSTSGTKTCSILANYGNESGNSSSSSQSSDYNYSIEGTFGSLADPSVAANLLFTNDSSKHLYFKGTSSWKMDGSFSGHTQSYSMVSKIGGDATFGSLTGLFKFATYYTDYTYRYGYGYQEIVLSDGTIVKVVANGNSIAVYVNGNLVS